MPLGVRLASTIDAISAFLSLVGPVVALHSGHGTVPLSVQMMIVILAGGLASVGFVVAVTHQSHGNVVPLLAVAVATQSDLLEIPDWQVTATTIGVGIIASVAARLLGIGFFGLTPTPVMGVDLLTGQDLVGMGVIMVGLFVLGAFVLLPRFAEDITDPERIRHQWLLACVVYGAGFLGSVPLVAVVVPGA